MSLCGTDDEQRQTSEDRAAQPMEAGGWVSQKKGGGFKFCPNKLKQS